MDDPEAFPLLRLIIIGIFIAGVIFAGFGVWLVILGAAGDTEFSLFGQKMRTTDIGIAAVFIGAVTIILLVRRVLATFDEMLSSRVDTYVTYDDPRTPALSSSTAEQAEPPIKSAQSLLERLNSVSDRQLEILSLIWYPKARFVYLRDLSNKLKTERSDLYYRLKDLERDGLIIIVMGNVDDYVEPSSAVRPFLKNPSIKKLLNR
jgi:hypothetical protein